MGIAHITRLAARLLSVVLTTSAFASATTAIQAPALAASQTVESGSIRGELAASEPVAIASPGEVVPMIDTPASGGDLGSSDGQGDDAIGLMPGLSDPAAGPASAQDPGSLMPEDERGADPVLAIDPVLEGISASRPVLRGLDKLLGNPAVAARPERGWANDDPELNSFAEADSATLDPPPPSSDPVWLARSRPPVSLSAVPPVDDIHGELGGVGFLAGATMSSDGTQLVVKTR